MHSTHPKLSVASQEKKPLGENESSVCEREREREREKERREREN
jgi:hypothetical protein